jgi:hypothetical protein
VVLCVREVRVGHRVAEEGPGGEQLNEDLGGGVKAESFAGPVVELAGDLGQVVSGVD